MVTTHGLGLGRQVAPASWSCLTLRWKTLNGDRGGQLLSQSLLAHGTDSRHAAQMFGAAEKSGVPAGWAVSPVFAPCSSLAAVLATLSLPLCEKWPEASSSA